MKHLLWIVLAAFALVGCGGAKLSVADEQLQRGEYYDASRTYRKVYNKMTKRDQRLQRGQVALKMGECYRRLGMNARASAAYQNAIRFGVTDSLATLRLAQSLHADGKYPQAVEAYREFLALAPEHAEATIGLRGAENAIRAKAAPSRYVVRQFKLINSPRADYAPQYLGSAGDLLYYTTTNEKVKGNNTSEITGVKKPDIWMMKKNELGQWLKPEAAGGELNTELEEGVCSFNPEGTMMYLTRARREPNASTGVEIYTSSRSDANWSQAQKFEITADTLSSVGHPAVSPNGEWLYFTSNMPGGQGGYDLWRINLKERGGSLENLGEYINTPGNEMFPYVRTDSVLYFASDGWPGMGGLDLFRAEQTPSGGWNVTNMGWPMNSPADDFGITFDPTGGERGFMSSSRGDARGFDHIYTFELPSLEIWISGWVIDRDEEPVPNAIIRIVGRDGSNQKAVAKDDGSFRFPLQRGVSYTMLASAPEYLNARQEFTSDAAEENAEYGVDFVLASINKPVVLENIFYDFDRASLRSESKQALDSLAQVLMENPNVTIEMGAHTDRKGSEEYNQRLSQRRAQAVVDYLIKVGVEAERLVAAGYGMTRPKVITKKLARRYPQFEEGTELTPEFIETLNDEDREIADQINRRTEFRVLSVDYQML